MTFAFDPYAAERSRRQAIVDTDARARRQATLDSEFEQKAWQAQGSYLERCVRGHGGDIEAAKAWARNSAAETQKMFEMGF